MTLSADHAIDLAPDGFILGRVIGRGGAGVVHEARQTSTGRAVAIKVLAAADGEVARRFERERGAMAELAGHPSIVSILDAGVVYQRPWLAMDLCPLGSLARLAQPMPVAEALTTMHDIATALQTAHAHGILHCDVKPANILLTGYGRPALSDFGIARLSLGGHPSTTAGGFTLDHVAPEVLEGVRPTDRADVYSLGTTAWQLLADRPPFRRPDEAGIASVMRRIQQDPLPMLPRDDVPGSLIELLTAMTAKDPRARPAAREVVARVEDVARCSRLALVGPLTGTAAILRALAPITDPSTTAPHAAASAMVSGQDPSAAGGRTDHRPDLADRTQGGRPAALAPPLHVAPPSPETTRRDPVVAVALVAVVTLVLALGGLTTWRLLPASPDTPTSSLTSPTGSTAEAAGPTSPVPVAASAPTDVGNVGALAGAGPLLGAAGSPGAGSAPQAAGRGVGLTTSGPAGGTGQPKGPGAPSPDPAPVTPPPATLTSLDLSNGTCTYSAATGTCAQASTIVSYTVKAVNSDGALPVTGCSATSTLVDAAGVPSSLGTVACNSHRVNVNTGTAGHYTVKVTASYHGSVLSRSFDLTLG